VVSAMRIRHYLIHLLFQRQYNHPPIYHLLCVSFILPREKGTKGLSEAVDRKTANPITNKDKQ
jgi:hypothetical protein